MAKECSPTVRPDLLNLTVPVSIDLPTRTESAPTGTVLYSKEASLAQWSGNNHLISATCSEKIRQSIMGRMGTSQNGDNTYATSLPGVGLRITVIYDKAGAGRKEWILPFSQSLADITHEPLKTDDIKLKIDIVKTGQIRGEGGEFNVPSLIALSDRSLVVNLRMLIRAAKAHCAIIMPEPQVELVPVKKSELVQKGNSPVYPLSINLQCQNTQYASLSIDGQFSDNKQTVFKNSAAENAAQGVGIEMLYNGIAISHNKPVDINLSQQQDNYPLPLSVRYGKSEDDISDGKVKAQITLHVNYL